MNDLSNHWWILFIFSIHVWELANRKHFEPDLWGMLIIPKICTSKPTNLVHTLVIVAYNRQYLLITQETFEQMLIKLSGDPLNHLLDIYIQMWWRAEQLVHSYCYLVLCSGQWLLSRGAKSEAWSDNIIIIQQPRPLQGRMIQHSPHHYEPTPIHRAVYSQQ